MNSKAAAAGSALGPVLAQGFAGEETKSGPKGLALGNRNGQQVAILIGPAHVVLEHPVKSRCGIPRNPAVILSHVRL